MKYKKGRPWACLFFVIFGSLSKFNVSSYEVYSLSLDKGLVLMLTSSANSLNVSGYSLLSGLKGIPVESFLITCKWLLFIVYC